MAELTERVFVYGTLKRGGGAFGLLSGCEPEGEAEAKGRLYDIGGRFPALGADAGAAVVRGEVYRCSAAVLPRLDDYEGVTEGLFRRVRLEIAGAPCWAYVAGPALAPRLRGGAVLPGGSWPPGSR